MLGLPAKNWVPLRHGPDGRPLLDAVIVGAGMYGLGAAIALVLQGIRNIAVLDRSPEGREGPWVTFARMETLRSPKTLPGPANGIPALTFEAWYGAKYGAAAWDVLYKAPNGIWQDYLCWLRNVLALPVRNGAEVAAIEPHAGFVRLTLADGGVLHARRVVLATGRNPDAASIPDFVDPDLLPDYAGHTCADIDFQALSGRRVAVVGSGASAWDNAAEALEAGASVDMFVRRESLPQVNKGRAPIATSPGFFRGWSALPDATRWAMAHYASRHPAPPPHETVMRVLASPGFTISFSSPVSKAFRDGSAVGLAVNGVRRNFDYLIVGTGFGATVDDVPLLRQLRHHIALWGDLYDPPAELRSHTLSRSPWVGRGFELRERAPGACAGLSRIHVFSPVAATSMGTVCTDVPGVNVGADMLSRFIVEATAAEDIEAIGASIDAFAETELIGTPFHVP
ncbi:MAG: NAD(P)/FAD-dependent oxidoreductase [Rhizobiaceae bacterium]